MRLEDTRANQAMDQTPRRAALAPLPALVIADRYAAWIWNQLDIPKMTWAHS